MSPVDEAEAPEPSDEPDALEELLVQGEAARDFEDDDDNEYQIIRFRSGGRDFAVPIDRVERTERVPLITPIPRSPSFIRGVASLRGGVVCVLNLHIFLTQESKRHTDVTKSMLVISDGSRRVGLLSDDLPDFERVRKADTMAVPLGDLDVYAGAIERKGKLIGILEPSKLFDQIERRLVRAG